jgi:hypothetical protein
MSPSAFMNAETIKFWVTEHFIQTGQAVDVKAIAAGCDLSVSTIRKAMSEAHGCIPGLVCDQASRPSYEHNYGTANGSHRVWVYRPSLETLRTIILTERSPR